VLAAYGDGLARRNRRERHSRPAQRARVLRRVRPDTDADGVKDNLDKCPSEAGPAPTGCSPDTDGDGVKEDNADGAPERRAPPRRLPGHRQPPATTTPAPTTPASTKKNCSSMKLKGKSLTAARKALTKAGCKLGKVTKSKRVKKGAKLVVTKQSGKNPVKRHARRQEDHEVEKG
jgi:hypothetical protein